LKRTIFSKKIAEKIGRFFGDFLGKNCGSMGKNRLRVKSKKAAGLRGP
jgi:hypothetical protein